jgi:putative membrane protein
MSSQIHAGSHSWSLPIAITLALIVLLVVYLRGWSRLRSAHPNVLGKARLIAFIAGVFVLWVAVGSPLAALDHQLLTVHMVQHLLLMTIAAPLILLGAPVITLWSGLPQSLAHTGLKLLLGSSLVQRLERIVAHPVFCWLASTAAVIGWHVPALFELGVQSAGWHRIEQTCFFMAGLLFWWPVVQPWPSLPRWPRWSVPLYLFLATLPCDVLSAFLTFCNRVVYPHYLSSHGHLILSPLGDQESAGALMWVWVTFAYLAPAAVVTIGVLSPDESSSKMESYQ